jgi:RHS repeat-associated protein
MGTPKELFNEEGECLWRGDHSLWGKASASASHAAADCNLRFQNQWEDEETGLCYNLHRYYDPGSGQYLSQDPIKLEGGLRTHGYVHDPLQWVDPTGLARCSGGGDKGGIIYLRRRVSDGEEYVGQAVPGRFGPRKGEHIAKHPREEFEFFVLEEVKPGSKRSLNVAEEDWIRAGGGPKRFGGRLANDRYQMSERAYLAGGGTVTKPTK